MRWFCGELLTQSYSCKTVLLQFMSIFVHVVALGGGVVGEWDREGEVFQYHCKSCYCYYSMFTGFF